jgi:uncharacterized protein (TIGR03118 family)
MPRIIRPTSQEPAELTTSARPRSRRHRGRTALIIAASMTMALVGATGPAAAHDRGKGHHGDNAFMQVNLISDLDTFGPGVLVDEAVKNPWGIDFSPTSPLWVANQLSDKVTVYGGANATTSAVTKVPIEVDANDPTGMVFNPTEKFIITERGLTAKANFLWNENLNVFDEAPTGPPIGQISGWSGVTADPAPLRNSRVVAVTKELSAYGGLTLVPATRRSGPRLLAADAVQGRIDVFNSRFQPVDLGPDAFVDKMAAEAQIAPYNVWYLNGRVYVAYAFGPNNESAVSVFKKNGKFIKRLVTNGPLAGPWGMAIAPRHWGRFGGALLVGNVEDGKINAFNRRNGHWLGALKDDEGNDLVNEGLWGIKFGNGTFGTPNDLIFAAGIGSEIGEHVYEHGLIGKITPVEDDDNSGHGS